MPSSIDSYVDQVLADAPPLTEEKRELVEDIFFAKERAKQRDIDAQNKLSREQRIEERKRRNRERLAPALSELPTEQKLSQVGGCVVLDNLSEYILHSINVSYERNCVRETAELMDIGTGQIIQRPYALRDLFPKKQPTTSKENTDV